MTFCNDFGLSSFEKYLGSLEQITKKTGSQQVDRRAKLSSGSVYVMKTVFDTFCLK